MASTYIIVVAQITEECISIPLELQLNEATYSCRVDVITAKILNLNFHFWFHSFPVHAAPNDERVA